MNYNPFARTRSKDKSPLGDEEALHRTRSEIFGAPEGLAYGSGARSSDTGQAPQIVQKDAHGDFPTLSYLGNENQQTAAINVMRYEEATRIAIETFGPEVLSVKVTNQVKQSTSHGLNSMKKTLEDPKKRTSSYPKKQLMDAVHGPYDSDATPAETRSEQQKEHELSAQNQAYTTRFSPSLTVISLVVLLWLGLWAKLKKVVNRVQAAFISPSLVGTSGVVGLLRASVLTLLTAKTVAAPVSESPPSLGQLLVDDTWFDFVVTGLL